MCWTLNDATLVSDWFNVLITIIEVWEDKRSFVTVKRLEPHLTRANPRAKAPGGLGCCPFTAVVLLLCDLLLIVTLVVGVLVDVCFVVR